MTSLSNCNVWRHNWRKLSNFWILFPKMTLGDGPKMLPIGVKDFNFWINSRLNLLVLFHWISSYLQLLHREYNSPNSPEKYGLKFKAPRRFMVYPSPQSALIYTVLQVTLPSRRWRLQNRVRCRSHQSLMIPVENDEICLYRVDSEIIYDRQ